jgi:hypothetical protein
MSEIAKIVFGDDSKKIVFEDLVFDIIQEIKGIFDKTFDSTFD